MNIHIFLISGACEVKATSWFSGKELLCPEYGYIFELAENDNSNQSLTVE